MAKTSWWTKSRGLPADSYQAWASSLASDEGRQIRVLAWAATTDGFCIGSPSVLSFLRDGSWTHLGWHLIETGGWDRESSALSWTLYNGSRGSVELVEPGRLPELFRERVSASIVLEKFVPLVGTRGVMISGRRDLSNSAAPIAWNTTLGLGLSWQTDEVRAAVDRALSQVRTEYDMG